MRMEGRTGPWEREYAWKEMGVSLSFSTDAHRLAEISEEKNLVRVVWDMDVGKEPGKQSQWREERGGESALSQCAGEVAGGASRKRNSRQEDLARKGSRIGAGNPLSILEAGVRPRALRKEWGRKCRRTHWTPLRGQCCEVKRKWAFEYIAKTGKVT